MELRDWIALIADLFPKCVWRGVLLMTIAVAPGSLTYCQNINMWVIHPTGILWKWPMLFREKGFLRIPILGEILCNVRLAWLELSFILE